MTREQTERYLRRIGADFPAEPTAKALMELQERHFCAVPYENLDILAGARLSLAQSALYEKIVLLKRGGYCFELNALFGWLLSSLGYSVTDYFGRFVMGEANIPKRRHHVLRVRTADDGDYVADVGVGVAVPTRSLRLIQGEMQAQSAGTYRFRRDGLLGWVLQDFYRGAWRDLYSFTEEPQLPVDFTAISYFCEYAPESPFNKKAIVAIRTPKGRVTLDGLELKRFAGKEVRAATLASPCELDAALRDCFGIELAQDALIKVFASGV